MTSLVHDKNKYEAYRKMLFERFSDISFENNPFKETYKYFISFEFDFIYNKLFFDGIKKFLGSIKDKSIVFYTIDPSPEEYFFNRFGKYSVFEISRIATDSELNSILMQEIVSNSGISICEASDLVALFSNSKSWAALGSQEWEVCIVGFIKSEIKKEFIESFSEDAQTMFTSIEQQVKGLDEMLSFDNLIKEEYYKLIKSYSDRST